MITTTPEREAPTAQLAPPRTITLLELVSELVDAGASDREVVAAVSDLIETKRVRLIGQVCEADVRTHA